MNNLNDNELLYLLSENLDFAFDLLMEKYQPMIISRLKRYNVKRDYWDDYYQECIILLYKCAISYREDITKTFNHYFDRLLQYQIKNLLRRDRDGFYRVVLMSSEEIDDITFERLEESGIDFTKFGSNEKLVRMMYDGSTIKEIALDNEMNYYQAFRVIRKLRNDKEVKKEVGQQLSQLERNIYELTNQGYRPKDIAVILTIGVNTVYNAVKRIKKKLNNDTE